RSREHRINKLNRLCVVHGVLLLKGVVNFVESCVFVLCGMEKDETKRSLQWSIMKLMRVVALLALRGSSMVSSEGRSGSCRKASPRFELTRCFASAEGPARSTSSFRYSSSAFNSA